MGRGSGGVPPFGPRLPQKRKAESENDMAEANVPIEEFARAMGVDARELAAAYARMEAGQLDTLERALNAESTRRPFECRALPQGARVAARIPEQLFYNLFFKKGFGMQERLDAQNLREVTDAFPQCRVETVSDRLTVGYRSTAESGKRKARVTFGRGTMRFAT